MRPKPRELFARISQYTNFVGAWRHPVSCQSHGVHDAKREESMHQVTFAQSVESRRTITQNRRVGACSELCSNKDSSEVIVSDSQ